MKRISDIRVTTFERDDGRVYVMVQGIDSGRGDIEFCPKSGLSWCWAILRCLKRLGAFND